jgi:hypothetical protein
LIKLGIDEMKSKPSFEFFCESSQALMRPQQANGVATMNEEVDN